RLWERLDRAKEDKVDFAEFVHYVLEHEKHLAIVFKDLDRNQDGLIDVRELRSYCQRLGLTVSDEQAALVVKRMGQAGSATIDIYEFQDYMLLCPSTDPLDIADFWRHNLVIDIGDDTMIPEDFSLKEIQSGVWWRHLVAGAVAGCMSRTCTAPLDRIKVFLQVHANRENKLRVMSAIRYLMKEGGVSSFWRGNGINVAKIAPESAIKFMAYEQIKRLIRKNNADGELAIGERFIAGSTAGAISQTVIYPMEVLKTRLALRKTGEMARGLLHFAQRLYETEGLQCFYRGYVPNLIGIIPYAGIDLAIYETLKANYVKRHEGLTEPGVLALLACGTCSSTCGQLASYPLALVRTRLQALGISNTPNQPNTMVGQFKYILSTEGVTGLYRGITPNFMKVVPAVGISYVVYETVRKRLGASMS
uniref:EF-hand domain-containing protein n=1 Tax=Plectus sambesii TaxID=2011161 RepID=A0A914XEQ0_9BILA